MIKKMAFGGQQKTTTGGCIRDSYNASEEEDKSEIWVVENGAVTFFIGIFEEYKEELKR